MEIKIIMYSVLLSLALMACADDNLFQKDKIRDLYVKDFESTDPRCTSADIDLNHSKAADFFRRSKILDRKTMTDNYDIAPCNIIGTLKYKNTSCEWKIFAGFTGSIKCGDNEWYFACDTCNDLFIKQAKSNPADR